jgi:prefoldin beta subunit
LHINVLSARRKFLVPTLTKDLSALIAEVKSFISQEQLQRKLKQNNSTMDENKIQEMQILEQRLQNLILQKQAFQMELAETDSALNEIEKAGDDVFKIIGQLMIKSEKSKIKEELVNKKKILELRTKSFQKQEESLSKQLDQLREEVTNSMKK